MWLTPSPGRGYRFKGQATVVDGGELLEQILAFYEAGDAPVTDAGTRVPAAVLVSVERSLPLVSPAYDLGLTEDPLRAPFRPHPPPPHHPPPSQHPAPPPPAPTAAPPPPSA